MRSLTVTGSWLRDADTGHELKSRAASKTIVGNRISDGNATASYFIDLPNGGRSLVAGNVVVQGPRSENPALVSYGAEGLTQPSAPSGSSTTPSSTDGRRARSSRWPRGATPTSATTCSSVPATSPPAPRPAATAGSGSAASSTRGGGLPAAGVVACRRPWPTGAASLAARWEYIAPAGRAVRRKRAADLGAFELR